MNKRAKASARSAAEDVVVRERPLGSVQRDALQRRPVFIGSGVLLAALSMLLGAFVLGANGKQRALIALSRDVPAGTAITRDMLRVERVDGSVRLAGIPSSSIDALLGKVTRVPLFANSLLQANHIGLSLEPPAGFAVVSIALDEGEAPGSLRFGDRVNVIRTSNSSEPSDEGGIIAVASVFSSGRDDSRDSISSSNSRRVMTLIVSSAQEVAVVQGIARGEVRLSAIAGGPIFSAESAFPKSDNESAPSDGQTKSAAKANTQVTNP